VHAAREPHHPARGDAVVGVTGRAVLAARGDTQRTPLIHHTPPATAGTPSVDPSRPPPRVGGHRPVLPAAPAARRVVVTLTRPVPPEHHVLADPPPGAVEHDAEPAGRDGQP